jgi:hypothetical protein
MIFYTWTAWKKSDRDAPGGRGRGRDAPGGGGRGTGGGGGPEAGGGGHGKVTGGGCGDAGSPVAMGITDDRGRAMKAGEETLGSGRAAVVIIEAVRPVMGARTLAPGYARTGVAWLGRRTQDGEVAWNRFFLQAGPDDQPDPGRIEP